MIRFTNKESLLLSTGSLSLFLVKRNFAMVIGLLHNMHVEAWRKYFSRCKESCFMFFDVKVRRDLLSQVNKRRRVCRKFYSMKEITLYFLRQSRLRFIIIWHSKIDKIESAQETLAFENIRFSSLFAAGDVSREKSPATKSEEKRMFSQAKETKKL